MKRWTLIIITSLANFTGQIHAQFYGVNYDAKTVAAMAAAFATEAAAEAYYGEQVQDMLKHYKTSEVATAGIFAGKFLERKARTDLGIWSSATENYYYRRIYHMVADKIIPKTWAVAKEMLRSPQAALYWASYLAKVCDDTKSLCMQFESIVTNSTLSFSDIAFLEISDGITSELGLDKIGGIDWQKLLDDMTQITGSFTKENLIADIDNLYSMGAGLATAGITHIGDALLQKNSFHELMNGKISEIIDIQDQYCSLFKQLESNAGQTILGLLGGDADVTALFNVGDYNLTDWVSDYLKETATNYFTQRWYIARKEQGSVSLCDYYPPTDDNSIIYGGEWTRVDTNDSKYSPTDAVREQALSNSESYAGWSRDMVQQMNDADDGYSYSISYSMSSYIISIGGEQIQKAYAYQIHAVKSWNNVITVYERTLDSYSMDLDTFREQMNALLSEFNDNEDGYVYYLGIDDRNYYQTTNEQKLKGCEAVTISVTCSDGATLGQGTTQYKCRECGGTLDAHSKECAMKTSVSGEDLDLSELDALKSEADGMASSLQSQISALEDENESLIKQITGASVEDAIPLREQYNANKEEIDTLKSELAVWQQQQEEIAQAMEEAQGDDDVETDDYYRIPALMQDCRTAYGITWVDDGSWSGYTYTREGTVPNITGTVTFKATLSIARKPKYFLGIKIHRAIMQISWELTTEYSDTHVACVMTLDPDMSDAEKTQQVNDRIAETAREYPDCHITTEYAKSDQEEDTSTDDMYHLLWSSDRLEIAREVDSRITRIYADLVSLEKMMHYKRGIIDVLKDVLPYVDDGQGRRLSLVEECHDRWIQAARDLRTGEKER